MFQGLINNVKSAAGSVVAKYAARASVAVPFVIALGFATAGAESEADADESVHRPNGAFPSHGLRAAA